MIQISGITLPESAVWENESAYGMPISEIETCANGSELFFQSGMSGEIDIYIPKIAGELTRETVVSLRELALAGNTLSLNINGQIKTVIFRHMDKALELTPINPKQSQENTDSYYGHIRLLEV